MSDGQEKELCNEHWPVELFGRINRQRTDGRHFCDVIVGCEDSSDVFPAHRCVLAASSDYFLALFSSRLGDLVVRDGICHVTINTSILDVSRDVVDTVVVFSTTHNSLLTT